MKINGIHTNKVVSLYQHHKGKVEEKIKKEQKDSLEISSLGKQLSSLSIEGKEMHSTERIEAIRKEVLGGTYQCDSTLVAKKIMEVMKRREI